MTLIINGHFMKKSLDIVLQDGSFFAVNPALADIYGGRFTKVSPAAVEVHCTYSLYKGHVIDIGISADKDSERTYLPDPRTMKDKLLLYDRGYMSHEYGSAFKARDSDFIGRAKDKQFNPTVLKCHRGFRDKKGIVGKKPKDLSLPESNADLLIEGKDKHGNKHQVRLVLFYVARKKLHIYLLTSFVAVQQ